MIKTRTCNLMFSFLSADNDLALNATTRRIVENIDFIPNMVRVCYCIDAGLNGAGGFNPTYIGTIKCDFLMDALNGIDSKEAILISMIKSGNTPINQPQQWQRCKFKEINTDAIYMKFKSNAYDFNFIPVNGITWNAGHMYLKLEFGLFQDNYNFND